MDLDDHAKIVCEKLLADLIIVNQGDSSIKFFRKDLTTMLIWLYIMDAYSKNIKINIEDISRGISSGTRISKPSLRLILENAKEQKFLKFTHSISDSRSWVVEPEEISISEFNMWTKKIV
jgi:hypothetical protein